VPKALSMGKIEWGGFQVRDDSRRSPSQRLHTIATGVVRGLRVQPVKPQHPHFHRTVFTLLA